ncbi:MAG TPA: hypothetical protein VIK53_14540 [Verrucomicrobiae bacterium]
MVINYKYATPTALKTICQNGVAAFGRKPPSKKTPVKFPALCRDAATPPMKIVQNNLSTFGVGGHGLLVSKTQHFTDFKGFPFVFNAFSGFAGIVAAGKTIVSAVKTSQWTAKTTPASAGKVVAASAGTSAIAKTIRAAVETISSPIAKIVAAFQTSPRTVQTISRAAKTISPTVNAVR